MRQGQNSKRSRGRGSGRRNVPTRHQTFDSNGPSVRIRGSAYQVHEKYLALARDAGASGDRIAAENYLQHAEHYFRIINADTDGDGRNRQNGAGRRGAEQGNGMDLEAESPMTEAQLEVPGEAASDVQAAKPNGSGEQPDVPAAPPAVDASPEEESAPKRRTSRGPGRGRSPRGTAKSRSADSGDAADSGKANPPAED